MQTFALQVTCCSYLELVTCFLLWYQFPHQQNELLDFSSRITMGESGFADTELSMKMGSKNHMFGVFVAQQVKAHLIFRTGQWQTELEGIGCQHPSLPISRLVFPFYFPHSPESSCAFTDLPVPVMCSEWPGLSTSTLSSNILSAFLSRADQIKSNKTANQ